MFHKRCTHLLQPLKCWVALLFYNLIHSIVKCVWLAVHNGTTWLRTTLSLSPLLGYFISPLWQLQQWSSLACFHDILCKPWHLISLREMGFETWGTRVAKPSSPRYMIYCTCEPGCEKCLCLRTVAQFLSFCLLCWQTCFFFLLFFPWGGLRFLCTCYTCRNVQSYKHQCIFVIVLVDLPHSNHVILMWLSNHVNHRLTNSQ